MSPEAFKDHKDGEVRKRAKLLETEHRTQLELRAKLVARGYDCDKMFIVTNQERVAFFCIEAVEMRDQYETEEVTIANTSDETLVMFYVSATLLPLCEGSLNRLISASDRWRRTPIEKKLSYALQIGQCLIALNQCGILHRDLKAGNVLVDSEGRLLISDFGHAGGYNHLPGTMSRMAVSLAAQKMMTQDDSQPCNPSALPSSSSFSSSPSSLSSSIATPSSISTTEKNTRAGEDGSYFSPCPATPLEQNRSDVQDMANELKNLQVVAGLTANEDLVTSYTADASSSSSETSGDIPPGESEGQGLTSNNEGETDDNGTIEATDLIFGDTSDFVRLVMQLLEGWTDAECDRRLRKRMEKDRRAKYPQMEMKDFQNYYRTHSIIKYLFERANDRKKYPGLIRLFASCIPATYLSWVGITGPDIRSEPSLAEATVYKTWLFVIEGIETEGKYGDIESLLIFVKEGNDFNLNRRMLQVLKKVTDLNDPETDIHQMDALLSNPKTLANIVKIADNILKLPTDPDHVSETAKDAFSVLREALVYLDRKEKYAELRALQEAIKDSGIIFETLRTFIRVGKSSNETISVNDERHAGAMAVTIALMLCSNNAYFVSRWIANQIYQELKVWIDLVGSGPKRFFNLSLFHLASHLDNAVYKQSEEALSIRDRFIDTMKAILTSDSMDDDQIQSILDLARLLRHGNLSKRTPMLLWKVKNSEWDDEFVPPVSQEAKVREHNKSLSISSSSSSISSPSAASSSTRERTPSTPIFSMIAHRLPTLLDETLKSVAQPQDAVVLPHLALILAGLHSRLFNTSIRNQCEYDEPRLENRLNLGISPTMGYVFCLRDTQCTDLCDNSSTTRNDLKYRWCAQCASTIRRICSRCGEPNLEKVYVTNPRCSGKETKPETLERRFMVSIDDINLESNQQERYVASAPAVAPVDAVPAKENDSPNLTASSSAGNSTFTIRDKIRQCCEDSKVNALPHLLPAPPRYFRAWTVPRVPSANGSSKTRAISFQADPTHKEHVFPIRRQWTSDASAMLRSSIANSGSMTNETPHPNITQMRKHMPKDEKRTLLDYVEVKTSHLKEDNSGDNGTLWLIMRLSMTLKEENVDLNLASSSRLDDRRPFIGYDLRTGDFLYTRLDETALRSNPEPKWIVQRIEIGPPIDLLESLGMGLTKDGHVFFVTNRHFLPPIVLNKLPGLNFRATPPNSGPFVKTDLPPAPDTSSPVDPATINDDFALILSNLATAEVRDYYRCCLLDEHGWSNHWTGCPLFHMKGHRLWHLLCPQIPDDWKTLILAHLENVSHEGEPSKFSSMHSSLSGSRSMPTSPTETHKDPVNTSSATPTQEKPKDDDDYPPTTTN